MYYFFGTINPSDGEKSICQIKTASTMKVIAFSSEIIANKYLRLKELQSYMSVIKQEELSEYRYDGGGEVLLVSCYDEMLQLANNPEMFPYNDYMTRLKL